MYFGDAWFYMIAFKDMHSQQLTAADWGFRCRNNTNQYFYMYNIWRSTVYDATCECSLAFCALLNLNIHTSYCSHAVNYSLECVTFWYVWNIRTTNFEILIGMSFSQMSNLDVWRICTYLSHLWRIRIFHMCDKYMQILHTMWQIHSNVKVKRICHKCEKFERMCHTCEDFVRIFHRCDKYVRILHFREGLARTFQICNTYALHVW